MYCAGVLTFDGGFMDSPSSRTKCITERVKTSQRQGLGVSRKPGAVQGDRAYWSRARHARLAAQGIVAVAAKPGSPHGSGLGVFRWVVERTLAWQHRFRRLALRYERPADVHEAFLTFGCALITWRYLKREF